MFSVGVAAVLSILLASAAEYAVAHYLGFFGVVGLNLLVMAAVLYALGGGQ